MKRGYLILGLICGMTGPGGLTWAGSFTDWEAGSLYATGHVLIQFKAAEVRQQMATAPGSEAVPVLLQRLNLPRGAALEEPAINRLLRPTVRTASALSTPFNLDRFFYLRLPEGLSVEACIQRLRGHPWVEFAEPDIILHAAAIIPNDPYFHLQWYHTNTSSYTHRNDIRTPLAWEITTGSTNVTVAVLDTGLYPFVEFEGRLVPGYNFVDNNTNTTTDGSSHGTAVAGMVGANANNGRWGAGVDWRCRIMPVKVMQNAGVGLASWAAQGIDFAVSKACNVINFSGSSKEFASSTVLEFSVSNAIAQGVIVVAAAGDEQSSSIPPPGSYPGVIAVGASGGLDGLGGVTSFGSRLDLVAPGDRVQIFYANPYSPGGYPSSQGSGTSYSAALVSGVCSLLVALRPDITPAQARDLVCLGAEDQVGSTNYDKPGFDIYYGWGRLNAYNTLLLAQTRIDQARFNTNHLLELSWKSPDNASNKQPYEIEFTTALANGWKKVESPGFRYTADRTYWTEAGAEALPGTNQTRFYRVRLRQLPPKS